MSSSEWQSDKLENLLEKLIDYRGKTPKKTTSGIPLITAKIVKDGKILEVNEYIADEDYSTWMVRGIPKKGDVVLTTEAPLGEVAQIEDENIALAQRIVTLRGSQEVLDNTYLKYFLISPIGQARLKERESGTTVTGIKQSELRKLIVEYPKIEIQRQIARILDGLDKKIEINNRMNKKLEQMAQAIFKQWFVDFEFPNENGQPYKSNGGEIVWCEELGKEIPKGWKVGNIGKIAIQKTENIQSDQIEPDASYIGLEHIPRKKLSLENCSNAADIASNKSCFKEGDILFGKLRPYFHKVIVAPVNGVCSTDILVINSKVKEFYGYLAMTLFDENLISYASQSATGTKMPRTNWKDISNYIIVLPQKDLLNEYNNLILDMSNQFKAHYYENNCLSNLRDTLLPKLMSGEIDVSNNEL